jgi:peptide/nickel transport system ATP-binding protein
MSDQSLLSIQDLRIYFSSGGDDVVRAVDGLDLAVGASEVVALVGASGSGKSMTALSIMRLLPRAAAMVSGKIVFEGKDLIALSEDAMRQIRGRGIAMIFQEPKSALNPVFTVGFQLDEVLRFHTDLNERDRKKQIIACLRDVGLTDARKVFDDYPHQLSGGMCQRIMIAQGLLAGARLLIADEPTSNLDVTLQAQILALLKDMRSKRQFSILLISHDLALVSHIADRVYVIQDGRIVEHGQAQEVLAHPKQLYTNRLLEAVRIV